jgi:hypothetical protein
VLVQLCDGGDHDGPVTDVINSLPLSVTTHARNTPASPCFAVIAGNAFLKGLF